VLPDEGTVGLRVMSENAPALALYTKLGFVPYSSVPSGP
jgi:ribosomal protein S18 acetylase RimI-like enzyme